MLEREKKVIKLIAEEMNNEGGRAYYVGGFVRDFMTGKENKDIDVEIHGLMIHEVEHILLRYGAVEQVGASFGVLRIKGYDIDFSFPRTERQMGSRHQDLAVQIDPFMGIQKASERRDFTINALMKDVLTGEVHDFFGGKEDIANGILRAVNPETFIEDPLRALRACQLAARFEMRIEPNTRQLIQGMSLDGLSKERIVEEVRKGLIKGRKPSLFFHWAEETGVLEKCFPSIKGMDFQNMDHIELKGEERFQACLCCLAAQKPNEERMNTLLPLTLTKKDKDKVKMTLSIFEKVVNPEVPIGIVQGALLDARDSLPFIVHMAKVLIPEHYELLKTRSEVIMDFRQSITGYDLIEAGVQPREGFKKILRKAVLLELNGYKKEQAIQLVAGDLGH